MKRTMRTRTITAAVVASISAFANVSAADFVKARVVEVDPAARTLTLEHGNIPNLKMPGMTMTFRVGEGVDLASIRVGEAIEFTAESIDEEVTVTEVRASP